jgi:hypothetical protein
MLPEAKKAAIFHFHLQTADTLISVLGIFESFVSNGNKWNDALDLCKLIEHIDPRIGRQIDGGQGFKYACDYILQS